MLVYSTIIFIFLFRNTALQEVPPELVFNQVDPHHVRTNEGTVSKKVTFGDLVRSSEMDEPDNRVYQSDREPSVSWNSKASAAMPLDDPNSSYSPYLPPVLEEPSSSVSEGLNFVTQFLYCFNHDGYKF